MPATIGAVAEGRVLRLREVGARPWVEDGGSGLIDHHSEGLSPLEDWLTSGSSEPEPEGLRVKSLPGTRTP